MPVLTVPVVTSAGAVDVEIEVEPALLPSTGIDFDYAASAGERIERAAVSFDEALGRVQPLVAQLLDSLRAHGPDEIELQFGIKIGGETGVVIAKGTVDVNFAVSMTWKKG